MTAINIGGRLVGPGEPCYIVAELGVNHQNDRMMMLRMVEEAANAGASAVKIQSYHRECFVSRHATYKGEAQADLFDRYQMSEQAQRDVAQRCRQVGVDFFGTPDCEDAAKALMGMGAVAIKVGSDDLTNVPLIEAFAKIGLDDREVPLILSTGMADEEEIMEAYEAAVFHTENLAFLHCVSLYPCPPEKANLQRIRAMLGEARGYSDHTDGIEAAVAAVAIGAQIIEKHFTLDRSLPGPDHAFSADPTQLSAMVRRIRGIEPLLGNEYDDELSDEEKAMRLVARRSIRSRFDCKEGTLLTRGHLVFQRPGDGLSPARLDDVLGKYLVRAKAAGDTIAVEDVR